MVPWFYSYETSFYLSDSMYVKAWFYSYETSFYLFYVVSDFMDLFTRNKFLVHVVSE